MKVKSNNESPISPLLDNPKELLKEARRRNSDYETISVHNKLESEYIGNGWEHLRSLKRNVKLRKIRPHDERLENEFWLLLNKMGYLEMNQGRNFKIKFKRHGAEDGEKQIDVFAKDDETVIVAECKSAEELKRKSLQKDIEEFGSLKGPIAKAIKKYYGPDFKPKILWVFVTKNIIWSDSDKERAKGHKIRRITERELPYFKQIAGHLGPAAKYQFLAEFFSGQKIDGLSDYKVPATRGKLGGRTFYSFVTTPKHLLKIAFVNHRTLNDPEGFPTYQRVIQKTRMKQIGKYLKKGGYFPTNILVNFSNKARFDIIQKDENADIHFGYLYLPDKYKSAWIIDGQHRLYGYSNLEDEYKNQNIFVLAFERMNIEEEANLFVTINHEQKSVPRSLLDDLEGDLKWGSKKPNERIGSIAARLIQTLNSDLGEPFYNRVAAQGLKRTSEASLTLTGVKLGIRRSGLIGRSILNNKHYELGSLCGSNDYETLARARRVFNGYFNIIREANYNLWNAGRAGFICTNEGIHAHLLLLSSLISYLEEKQSKDYKLLSEEDLLFEVQSCLSPIIDFISKSNINELERRFKVPFGSGGPPLYHYRLCNLVRRNCLDFCPDGYMNWEETQSEERKTNANKQLERINTKVLSYIFSKFKNIYGEENNAYWERGVLSKDIKSKAYTKSLEDDISNRMSLENYLDFIELKKIIKNEENWRYFKEVFNIPMPGDKGIAKNLRWMDKVNELRRIPAHPSEQRQYKLEDFTFLDWIHSELQERLSDSSNEDIHENN